MTALPGTFSTPSFESFSGSRTVGVPESELKAIADVCQAVAAGDLDPRIPELADPQLESMREAINHLLDLVDAFVREAGASLTAAGEGRFHRIFLERGMPGTFRQQAVAINTATESMSGAAEKLNGADQHVQRARATVADLERSSAQIEGVVGEITRIAQQTRLLALNAAIEAARAGDAGVGFEVVAHEVKALASQTAASTGDIARTISDMQAVTREAVAAIDAISEALS